MDDDTGDLRRLIDALSGAETGVALTGAGVSAASGVPTFRGEGGIWNTTFDPADFHYSRFQSDPAGFWRDRVDLHEALLGDGPEPNAAHDALARLERAGVLEAVVTQNTDGLHADAGTDHLVELHGCARRVVCECCGERSDAGEVHDRVRDGAIPPRCDCGGVLKPDVVLFGERLPERAHTTAQRLARESDVFLAAGSSLQVEPAATLPRTAARDGLLAVVNLTETGVDDLAEVVLRGDVGEVLPAVADGVGA